MMILIPLFSSFLGFAHAASTPGMGGMSECVSMAMQVALKAHAKSHLFQGIPEICLGKSDGSPSNGLDFKVKIDDVTYYVIASTNSERNDQGVPVKLKGCSDARVGYTKP